MATVVCLASAGKGAARPIGSFDVSMDDQEQATWQGLAEKIAEGCAGNGFRCSEVAVALDSALYMQHAVNSEFTDARKIAATVRFDAEEALATDVSNLALSFTIDSVTDEGASLTVFTARQDVLSEIILSLQSNNIDPVTIEPDVVCLSRYITGLTTDSQDSHTLLGFLSGDRGYLLARSGEDGKTLMRTFLVGSSQNRTDTLAREAVVTAALADPTDPVNTMRVFDTTGPLDTTALGRRLNIPVEAIDLTVAGTGSTDCPGSHDPVRVAIASGAAAGYQATSGAADFRGDFMPYQGRMLRLRRAVRFLSISVILLALAAGGYFQMQLMSVNRYRNALRSKFEPDYLAVMLDAKKMPSLKKATGNLGSILRRIENDRKGVITDKEAITAKLTLVLEAFNSCARPTDLSIDTVTISTANIIIVGDTSSRANTLRLFESIKQVGLEILQQRLDSKEGRDKFSITVVAGS